MSDVLIAPSTNRVRNPAARIDGLASVWSSPESHVATAIGPVPAALLGRVAFDVFNSCNVGETMPGGNVGASIMGAVQIGKELIAGAVLTGYGRGGNREDFITLVAPGSLENRSVGQAISAAIWDHRKSEGGWQEIARLVLGDATAALGIAWPVANAQWAELDREVRSFSNLPDDWDGDDGRGPPPAVIAGALVFLARARSAGVSPPRSATVDGDGEVAFRWKAGGASASAAFLPDGHIVAYATTGNEDDMFRLDQPFDLLLDLDGLFQNLRITF